ncbi:zinc ribbon domain-containing protein [Poriferisphaera sp. WC338]|uniref:zinc ribbon domain-containing protein n=1 Tax=Poriferisphaera sp. WC338 TaxID=3425129 RepID=UPI003D816552
MSLQENLYELFLLDQQLRGLRSRLDAALRRQAAQQRKLGQLVQQSTEIGDQLRHQQAHAATMEKQSDEIETRITEARNNMNAVTNNKEYSALLVEVNTLKIDKSKAEDEALESINAVEESTKKFEELNEQSDQQRKLVENSEKDVKEAREAVGDRLDQVQAERDTAAGKIPADTLATFERLIYEHDGEAMAEVELQDTRRKEYICGGCFIQLPIERLNSIIIKPDAITSCPTCGRILFLKEDAKVTLGGK